MSQGGAGVAGDVIDQHRAGTAFTSVAAEFRAGQPQLVAQGHGQGLLRQHIHSAHGAIDSEGDEPFHRTGRPGRLGATYIGEDGNKHVPVMLHRAIFGSLERFIGILIEHHAGNLPLWLAPVQVKVLTITSDADEYAAEIEACLRANGMRAETDIRNEKISYKVREHSVAKVPVQFAVGQRELENRSVAIRRLGSKKQEVMSLDDAIAALKSEISNRGMSD